jgi:hypothetical protein
MLALSDVSAQRGAVRKKHNRVDRMACFMKKLLNLMRDKKRLYIASGNRENDKMSFSGKEAIFLVRSLYRFY